METYQASSDIDVITTAFPVPGLGCVAINAFVLKGKEPLLVDTGPVVHRAEFMATLRSIIDPAELRWLWLTHTDPDHIGSLGQLMSENPRLRVVTTYLAVGIMSLSSPVPLDRVYLVNPGEKLALPDRTLTAFRPPVFDNPTTTGFYDDGSRALFTSDCFGALLEKPPHNAADISGQALHDGQVVWATIDAPWLHKVDRDALGRDLRAIRSMEPAMILSSHLPAADGGLTDRMLTALAEAPRATPFVGPNQHALKHLLEGMSQGG